VHLLRRLSFSAFLVCLIAIQSQGQSTNGLLTGSITDSSGASVPAAQVTVTNPATGVVRTSTSNDNGTYIVPQLVPGSYSISVEKQGFGSEKRENVQLEVNQSITLDFKLGVASAAQTVEVTGAAPTLNTTSSTLTDVIDHNETVDLPLNGREFTQLTLLTPGAAPVTTGQQSAFTVALGKGGISPSVNGQRGQQNNFTMDGTLNNAIFTNGWSIAPPPDALQEFAVQSHITDAQFSISSGANINVVTRSGTNTYHGALWEFFRNDALDAQTFPDTFRAPYHQNQYGLYFGGPFYIPHVIDTRNNTWFSLYWEGFRSSLSGNVLSSTLTQAMDNGDFSAVLGAQVGTDSLNRPEYANEIYDPLTSRPDPANPGSFIRDPFPGNKIPQDRLNPSTLLIIQRYYPLPNLNVAPNVLPNYQFTGVTSTKSDVFGGRLDHSFGQNDTLFARFNRSNQHVARPEQIESYSNLLINYSQQAAVGFTHLFNPSTILNLRFGYTYTNFDVTDEQAGLAFNEAINFEQAVPTRAGLSMGPQVSLSNGYNGVSQFAIPLGPLEGEDYHADFSKVKGNHTIGVGAMYYHIKTYDDGWGSGTAFTQNGTAQNATAGPTGFGPASFMLGVLNTYSPWIGSTGSDQSVNWWGFYGQDQWQVSKKLVLTAGLRWDYVAPPNYHKVVSGLNVLNGQFIITQPFPPLFPNATGQKGFFAPQYNGWEPRFGVTYQAAQNTVLHGAFAILDDHNNSLVQANQGIRLSWPTAISANFQSLDLGVPTTYLNALPSSESILSSLAAHPYATYGANPDNKIPYAMEFNLGVQQQLPYSMVLKADYVGSLSRHQYINMLANTALFGAPGPIADRQPFPQYGGPFSFEWNEGTGNYNALQTELTKKLSQGLFFRLAYTYSKSMDIQSDPYGNEAPNFYDFHAEYGPSTYSLTHMLVFSSVYQLPFGKGKTFLSNPNWFVQMAAGNWNLGSIIAHNSGQPFNALVGTDLANTGGPNQRPDRVKGANLYTGLKSSGSSKSWLNTAALPLPATYTYGNEGRNDLVGPGYTNVDISAYKDFPIHENFTAQFRGEFFNLLNHSNYALPNTTVQSGTFGLITSAAGQGRQVQFALKILF
jgi:Carboxypeptidase regulatory-like domain/TonB dependent receptor